MFLFHVSVRANFVFLFRVYHLHTRVSEENKFHVLRKEKETNCVNICILCVCTCYQRLVHTLLLVGNHVYECTGECTQPGYCKSCALCTLRPKVRVRGATYTALPRVNLKSVHGRGPTYTVLPRGQLECTCT